MITLVHSTELGSDRLVAIIDWNSTGISSYKQAVWLTALNRPYTWSNWALFFSKCSVLRVVDARRKRILHTKQRSPLWVLHRLSLVWCQSNLQTKTQLLPRDFFQFRLSKKVMAAERWEKNFLLSELMKLEILSDNLRSKVDQSKSFLYSFK